MNHLAATFLTATMQRGIDAERRLDAGDRGADRAIVFRHPGLAIHPFKRQGAGQCVHVEAMGRQVGPLARQAITGDQAVHQVRIDREEARRINAKPARRARLLADNHHVGPARDRRHRPRPCRRLRVEGDTAGTGVQMQVVDALVVEQRRELAIAVAMQRMLDLQDIGTQLQHAAAGDRPGEMGGKVRDFRALAHPMAGRGISMVLLSARRPISAGE